MYAGINVLTKLMYFQQILYLLGVNKYYGYGYGYAYIPKKYEDILQEKGNSRVDVVLACETKTDQVNSAHKDAISTFAIT